MKKKRLMIIAAAFALIAIIVAAAITLAPKWSEKSFEAVAVNTVIQPDGEVRLIAERKTEIYGPPLNVLGISDETALVGLDGEQISVEELKQGTFLRVTLKDAFVEENPFYYPTVYEIKVIGANK